MVCEWVTKQEIMIFGGPFLVVLGGDGSLHTLHHFTTPALYPCAMWLQWTWSLFLECGHTCVVSPHHSDMVEYGESRHLKLDKSGSKFFFWLLPTVWFWANCLKTTASPTSRLSHECFLWGSYPVLYLVNKWIRNLDKYGFPAQCENTRACCVDGEGYKPTTDVGSSYKMVQLCCYQLKFPAPSHLPHLESLHKIPPSVLERVTQSHRTCGFCFLKNQNQGSSWQQMLTEYWLCAMPCSRCQSYQGTRLSSEESYFTEREGTELQGWSYLATCTYDTWVVSGQAGIWTHSLAPEAGSSPLCFLLSPGRGLKIWEHEKSRTHVCGSNSAVAPPVYPQDVLLGQVSSQAHQRALFLDYPLCPMAQWLQNDRHLWHAAFTFLFQVRVSMTAVCRGHPSSSVCHLLHNSRGAFLRAPVLPSKPSF